MSMDVESPYTRPIQIGSATIGGALPFVLIAGAQHSVTRDEAISLAEKIEAYAVKLEVPFIFTLLCGASGSDAERLERLETLREIKSRVGCPVSIDVFQPEQIGATAEVVDFLRIPSALNGETDLVLEAARTGKPVNIEKGLSLSPDDAIRILEDVAAVGNWNVLLTEQGTTLGGKRLVDVSGFAKLKESGFPLIFDTSHSLSSGFSPSLSTAGIAAGADALLVEVSAEESTDGTAACPLDLLPELLRRWKGIDGVLKNAGVD